jgi:hypothetical protein
LHRVAHRTLHSQDYWYASGLEGLKSVGAAVPGEDRRRAVAGHQGGCLDPGALGSLHAWLVGHHFESHGFQINHKKIRRSSKTRFYLGFQIGSLGAYGNLHHFSFGGTAN